MHFLLTIWVINAMIDVSWSFYRTNQTAKKSDGVFLQISLEESKSSVRAPRTRSGRKKNRLSVFHTMSSQSCQKSIHNSVLFVNLTHLLIDFAREQRVLLLFALGYVRNFWKIKNEWKWQYADKASSLKREKTEPRASDNCIMCGCCFKTQFGNFKSGWRSSENMFDFFLCPYWKKVKQRYLSWPTFYKRTLRCPRRRRIFLHKSFLASRNKVFRK